MKTKEFIGRVLELGFGTIEDEMSVSVTQGYGKQVLLRVRKQVAEINFEKITFSSEKRLNLLSIATEYLNTPLAEREEEKRHYLLLDAPEASNFTLYLTKGYGIGGTNLNVQRSYTNPLFIFTESEISQMDITGFEKIEVTE